MAFYKCVNGCNCDAGELVNGICFDCRREMEERDREEIRIVYPAGGMEPLYGQAIGGNASEDS